jgi:hypothetical protein
VRSRSGLGQPPGRLSPSSFADRSLERQDVPASKAACDKPVAADSWPLERVARYWDRLELHSDVLHDGRWVPYQEGALSYLRPLDELLGLADAELASRSGAVMFLGTLPLKTDGFVFGDAYRIMLRDPVSDRQLSFAFHVTLKNPRGGLQSR